MLCFNFCFNLALIVFTITATSAEDNDNCNLIDEILKTWCKVLTTFYPHDNGQLGAVICGCVRSIMKSDPSYCQPKDYDFAAAPHCGKLFKSDDFVTATKIRRNFLSGFTKNLYRHGFNVCTEKDEERLFKAVSAVYQPGVVSDFYFFVAKNGFPAKLSNLYFNCYKQLIELSPKPSGN